MARKPRQSRDGAPGSLPSRDDILAFIAEARERVGKREIARAFALKGANRVALKRLLAEMAEQGLLSGNRKSLNARGVLPPVSVLNIVGRDPEGELAAEPAVWPAEDGARPRVLVLARRGASAGGEPPFGQGDRILARISKLAEADVYGYQYEAEPIRRLPSNKTRALGIFRTSARGGGTIEPIDRKQLRSWSVREGDEGGAADGDLVRFDLASAGRHASPAARVDEVLGNPNDQRKISLIAVHAHGLPDEFPADVLAEAERLTPPTHVGRTDLTRVPLLTIDPADARDHDDAVHAADDADPRNPGGFLVTVAIADVAYYVRPGTRLDREARQRGNSVYFPDRVVPMLPEAISNDACSLRFDEERPCLAVEMVFDASGAKRRHRFVRATMRSAAKLSYQQAQAAFDGQPDKSAEPLMDTALRPLWRAYQAVAKARDARAPLDLDLPERKIVLDGAGRVARVTVPERLAAHRLIEEFMIQANVAAAETLEEHRAPVVYRVHGAPSQEKLAALRDFLATLDLKLPPASTLRPAHFNTILVRAKSMPVVDLVNEVILRAQAQAEYATENIGHFGLHLRRYAHFTSPIRRYADLLVHRSLIRALKLGPGGMEDGEEASLSEVAQSISQLERRAMAAERETTDRLIAAFLADRIGAEFDARVSGVTRSGLFVRLRETGADGFVPAATIGDDYYRHDEKTHALIGDRTGETYRLGDDARVRLVEAIPTAGALRFEILSPGGRASQPRRGGIRNLRRRRDKGPRPRR